jgi:hypothetical protein
MSSMQTSFQDAVRTFSGPFFGLYMWSSPGNWTNGVPTDGGGVTVDVAGIDDLPNLSLSTFTSIGGVGVLVDGGTLTIGSLIGAPTVSAIGADGLAVGATFPATVTIDSITQAGGDYDAQGPTSSFIDLSTTDVGGSYFALNNGTVVLNAPPAANSILGYQFHPGTIELEYPAATNAVELEGVAPGDVLELPGTSIAGVSGTANSPIIATNAGRYAFTNVSYAAPVGGYTAAFDAASGLEAITFACFAEGTRIRTPRGEVPVEDLTVGAEVELANGGTKPVIWIGKQSVEQRARPVHVRAHAFPRHVPRRDLWLSPDHAVHMDGVLIPVRYLMNGCTIVQEAADEVTYYHVELASHDVLLAEGLPCESYLDTGNRSAFATSDAAHPRSRHLRPSLNAERKK